MFENVTVCPSLKFRRLCAGVVVASCVVMMLFMVLAHDWSFEVSASTSHDRDVIIIDDKRVATREHVSGAGALTGASLYGCILKKTCDVTNSGRNGQLAIDAATHHHSSVALVTMLHHSLLAQSTHPLILLYVVEDGCALGHLMKDVGVLLEVAALLPTGRSVAVEELHIVFGNRCASRATWQLSDSSLFGAILAPWWRHVIALAAELLSRGAVRTPIHVGFADEWDRWKSTHRAAIGEGSIVVIRRPVRWRWFYQNSHAALLRNAVLLQSDGVTPHSSPPGVEPSSSATITTITIIKRRKNRRIYESGIADIAHSIAAPWRHPIIGASHSRPSEAIRVQVVDTEGMSFVDQVRLFANTDILIAAHGAALAFTMFMNPAYAVVIELFPYQFGYWIYEELAMSVGLEYHIVRGQRPSSSCSRKAPCKAPITSMRQSTEDNLYGALRAWNGHSSCKNCDVMWCPTPSTLSMEDQREETLNETICLHRIMVPQLRDVVRRVAVKKIRRGFSLGEVNTTRWLDRRS